jgi:hypothetical protein
MISHKLDQLFVKNRYQSEKRAIISNLANK